jgi:hypothetical protein
MTRRNINSQHRLLAQTNINGSTPKKAATTTSPKSKSRIDSPPQKTKQPSLSLYIPHSRRKNSPQQNLASPVHIRSSPTQEPTIDDVPSSLVNDGTGTAGDEEEEAQSDDVDDDNICLVCVAKCTCGKTQTQQQPHQSRHSPSGSPHFTRQSVKLRLSSPGQDNADGKGRERAPPRLQSPILLETNGHAHNTRSHTNVIIRDGRGHGNKNELSKKRRLSEAKSEIMMDISDIDLDQPDEEEEESSEDEEEDDYLGDIGDELDIEEEEERNIIEEETRRMTAFSDEDDDADEEDELDEEEDIFQEKHYSSSESSPDEDQEFYQNDLYLDAVFGLPAGKLISTPQTHPVHSDVVHSDLVEYDNPILNALIEEHGLPALGAAQWDDGDDDQVGWECFIDDTDVDMGDDWMHVDEESTRIGGGDTTDEEDFKLLGPSAPSPKTKRKQKKANDIVADVITTAHQPPPLATWERDGKEIPIIDTLPPSQSPLPPASSPSHPFPLQTPDIPALEDYFTSKLLASPDDNDEGCVSDASLSSNDTVTRDGIPRPRKDSTATATSIMTDSFTTPITTQTRDRRKVPLGSYRRKVMLGERTLEAQEKSVFLKEWYTLQERRSQRKITKFQRQTITESPFLESSPARGRRRDKLRTARRERRDHGEMDMSFIKRRRTSDVQGSGSSSAAVMERLGLEMGEGEISEDDEDDYEAYYEEFGRDGCRVLNGVQGERMVLDDDLELAQFIVPPPGGIDLSPLFGAVDAS